jgi:hypothetical protein
VLDRVRCINRSSGRRALRRAVTLDCEVFSDSWDGPVSLPATDLSHLGLWLQTPLPLDRGEEVIVTLTPPRWPYSSPLVALAMVVRVGLYRRRRDLDESGMGLAFADLEANEVSTLVDSLRGLPPPLPVGRRDPVSLEPAAAVRREPSALERIVRLADGSFYAFTAESALLTGGRSAASPPRLRLVWSRGASTAWPVEFRPRIRRRIAA